MFTLLIDKNTLKSQLNDRLQRYCHEDTTINGIDFKKDTMVSSSITAVHYNPKIWAEPEKFDPYRFTKEEKAKHSPYDWLPFGVGPRNCIAMRLVIMEVKIVVAYFLRKYRFIRSDKTEVNVYFKLVLRYKYVINILKNGHKKHISH